MMDQAELREKRYKLGVTGLAKLQAMTFAMELVRGNTITFDTLERLHIAANGLTLELEDMHESEERWEE